MILNAKRVGLHMEGAVYVGRPSKWGNPFIRGVHGTREQVIDMFADWVVTQPDLIEEAKQELRGMHLICWCAPKSCHADVWQRIIDDYDF